ncbi:uncharacterized protein FIBRA_00020 [Fibroporia radiculosa]|uniref:Uncharacterized protein n=1 Tax=Fibroporia radiculosa TaxID=599839 RepID=J7RFZ7_9APHY|nr:uncharacterized protein FIBRA_00020 [Fibroporia radiculosa]CCL98027.1 predicted protein [Fibroporia radiculosa]
MPRTSSPTWSLPPRNQTLLDRSLLHTVLHDLSSRLLQYFGRTVRLVVHGGVIMVLHPRLASRSNTRDVDYNHRSFVQEWRRLGVKDAGERLKTCITATACRFNLGADWMNADADVALPYARDVYGNVYDSIWTDAISARNLSINTIFTSPGLVLVGVSWSWAVALKLVRYQKYDPYDIANILRLGRQQRGVRWTRKLLEDWLVSMCGAMNYAAYPPWYMETTRDRMRDAIRLAEVCA